MDKVKVLLLLAIYNGNEPILWQLFLETWRFTFAMQTFRGRTGECCSGITNYIVSNTSEIFIPQFVLPSLCSDGTSHLSFRFRPAGVRRLPSPVGLNPYGCSISRHIASWFNSNNLVSFQTLSVGMVQPIVSAESTLSFTVSDSNSIST